MTKQLVVALVNLLLSTIYLENVKFQQISQSEREICEKSKDSKYKNSLFIYNLWMLHRRS